MPNMDPKKCPMPVQDPDVRNKNFNEVALGYTYEMAVNEAKRCLNCKNKPCVTRLPGEYRYPRLHRQGGRGGFGGRVCRAHRVQRAARGVRPRVPAGEPVRGQMCSRHQDGEPCGIGRLERFVADWHREHSTEQARHARAQRAQGGGHRLRPVRADGCAGDLAKLGYKVTVYEALHTAGRRAGVRHSGIPSAQGHRAPGDRRPEGAGRRHRDQRGHWQDAHHRRAVRNGQRGGVHRHRARACPGLWAFRARA